MNQRLAALSIAAALALLSPQANAEDFTVGPDAACTHATLQQAVDAAAANGPELDFIYLSNQVLHGPVQIHEHSVWIRGGYDDCSRQSQSARSELVATAGVDGPVVSVVGSDDPSGLPTHLVILQGLVIRGARNSGDGGGIFMSGTNLSMDIVQSEVRDNHAERGGGLWLDGKDNPNANVTLLDSVISDNHARRSGGGLHALELTRLRIIGTAPVRFEANSAGEDGGGVYAQLANLSRWTSAAVEVSGNTAGRHGGGIAMTSGSTYGEQPAGDSAFLPLVIAGNTAGGQGGGLLLEIESQLEADGLVLRANTAQSGGGASVDRGHPMLTVTGREGPFECDGNRAELGGSCLWAADRAMVRIERAEIHQNDGNGSDPASTVRASDMAVVDGEGWLMHRNGPGFELSDFALAQLRYATIADNGGTSFRLDDSSMVSLAASIVDDPGHPLLAASPKASFLPLCVIASDGTGLTGAPDNLLAPGDFVDRTGGDYRLRLDPANPAIDRCDGPASDTPDLDGRPRGHDLPEVEDLFGPWDVGAYEAYSEQQALFGDGFEASSAGQ